MPTLIHQHVEDCRNGRNPRMICRVRSGWVVMGQAQFVRGYSLLLPDPVVPDLNRFARPARDDFLRDMVAIGDALLEVTNAVRINYEMLGNLEPALHAHVFPRYADEPEALRTRPVWFYDWEDGPGFDPSRDESLMAAIRGQLREADVAI